MSDVFISYGRSTANQAQAAAAALRTAGYSVWLDEDLPTHRAYADVIEEQLLAAKAVMVIWSAEAVKSQWVRSEANRGRDEGKLVQVRLDTTRLPMPFDQLQCVSLAGWTGEGEHPAWPKVVAHVAGLVSGEALQRPEAGRASAPAEPLLAVLPFDAPARGRTLRALADGLPEEIIQTLMNGDGPKVIGRTSSFRYRGELKAGAAASLGASHVLDGAVRAIGDKVRVSAQLIDTASGAALWGGRFDRDAGDALAAQDDIAAEIAEAVRRAVPATQAASATAPANHPGERRHLTVLSCRLADATRIASGLDPEEWRALSGRFQSAVGEAAASAGGHIARAAPDGLTAYFGWPEAHEDAAERAVRAGLAMVEAVGALGREEGGHQLKARVGLHAGTVVAARTEGAGIEMFGEAPRIAEALQATAPAGAVLMTASVHELVAGLFVVEDRGEHPIGGLDQPTRCFRVHRLGLASGRARGFAPSEASPFVGREDELNLLLSRWRRVCEGDGQSVLMIGEPGIGKTRLLEEFRAQIKGEPHLWIECSGAPLNANTPFHAVSRMLGQGLGWNGEDSAETRLARLEANLAASGLKVAEAAPLIAEMMNLPAPDRYEPLAFPPDQKRRRLLAVLTTWVFSATRAQPLVIVVEDLHWIDPSTLELIQTLVEQGADAPLLLLCTSRPEFRPDWPTRGHHVQVALGRLNDRQTRRLVRDLVARAGIAEHVRTAVDEVLARADGVPLFAEELVRLVSESPAGTGTHVVPVTLLDSLAARLDRLGRAKEVAQLAAVLGREFSYELIAAVSSQSEAELQADLTKLADAGLISVRGLPPDASYLFRHALMQDAAYDALLRSRRRELHAKAAEVIDTRFAWMADNQPEVIARHWSEAGAFERAIEAWMKAGDAAYARQAFKEAENDYRRALEALSALPASPERDARELSIISPLNRVLQLTRGYAAPETVEIGVRARALAEAAGSVAQLIREEARVWQALITSGDYAGATVLAEHILELIHLEGDEPGRLLFAHEAQLQVAFYTGDLAGAEAHFEAVSPLLAETGLTGAPGGAMIGFGVGTLSAWVAGRAATAHARLEQARAFADRTGNPYDQAILRHFAGTLAICENEPETAAKAAGELLELAETNGLAYLGNLAHGALGWAKTRLGEIDEGVELMRRSCHGRAGAAVGLTFGLIRLAEGLALAGRADEALETLEQAMSVNPQERVFEPAALIGRGEIRAARGEKAAAEADFRQASALAEELGAGAWALRAAMARARLLSGDSQAETAARLVAEARAGLAEPPCAADLAALEA